MKKMKTTNKLKEDVSLVSKEQAENALKQTRKIKDVETPKKFSNFKKMLIVDRHYNKYRLC